VVTLLVNCDRHAWEKHRVNKIHLLLVLLPLLVACNKQETASPATQPAAAQAVRVTAVATLGASTAIPVAGRVEGKEEVRLAFKVSGIIQSITVDAGDSVKAGQVLASLDPVEIRANAEQAQTGADKARRDLTRAEQLNKQGVVSTQVLQDTRSQHSIAQAALESARFNLEHAVIVAPADGVVLAKLAEARETVAAGVPVISLGRADSGWVIRAGLADRLAVQVQPGDAVDIEVDALPASTLHGQVARLGAASDPRTGTVEAEITVDPAGHALVSGWIAHARIQASRPDVRPDALVIPANAVLEASSNRAHVYVWDKSTSTVQRADISVGALIGEQVVVTGGLQAGQQVVSEGAAWLRDGAAVVVK
jgi:multidrug efflux system membrane fusion protein